MSVNFVRESLMPWSKARDNINKYGRRWTGIFRIIHAGAYKFSTESDNGSWMWINNVMVVSNGGSVHHARLHSPTLTSNAIERKH